MTTGINDHPQLPAVGTLAGQFAQALREAMTARRLNIKRTAALTGVNAQTISNLVNGRNEPRISTASALAEALHDETLVAMVERDRRRVCSVCERTYVTQHTDPKRRRFCSHRCQQTAWNRSANEQRARQRARYYKRDKMLLREYQVAVDAFCVSCEPLGLCRSAECELRPVSKLPFVPLRVVRRAA